jgi:hypothetical protein
MPAPPIMPSVPGPPSPAFPPAQATMKLRLGDAVADVAARLSEQEAFAARWAPRPASVDVSGVADALREPSRGADLSLLARRSRLKAQACRWAAQRRQRLAAGADRESVYARDRELFTDARAIANCYLWMMDPGGPLLPAQDATLDELAGCYDAVAAAADLLVQVDQQEDRQATDFERDAFDLAAQAQSALRVALSRVESSLVDADQEELFWWLRGEASEARRGILIVRHMRRDDGADPTGWIALLERIDALRARLDARRQAQGERKRLLGKLQYHAKRIAQNGAAAGG